MNFNFGEVLTRAWQIIWKHKVLWIFGIWQGAVREAAASTQAIAVAEAAMVAAVVQPTCHHNSNDFLK